MIKFFLDPFNLLMILSLLAILVGSLRSNGSIKVLAISAFAWFILISTPLVPTLLLDSLESRFEPVYPELMEEEQKNAAYHIVVLGGGHGYDDRLPPNSLLSLQALARLNEGVRLHNQLPNSTLILSGYSASGRTPQAEMLNRTALLLGVDSTNTLTQPEPGNTTEEAMVYREKFGIEAPVILVTSAAHMPRAAAAFSHVGIDVSASPAHYRILESGRSGWIGWPSVRNISNMRTGMNEYAAIARDWWLNSELDDS